jgi:DNA-binding transcriptional LysR family regulator
MDLHQLRTFLAVAAAGHVTRAAEKLHLSQPTVSGHIKALEEELGVSLFDRAPAGVSLTHSGRLLLEDAEKVIAASQHLRDHARALSGNLDAKLRIGAILDPDYLRLGELVSVVRERYPMLETELHQAISGVGADKVRSGELDAAFVLGDQPQAGLRVVPLEPQLYVVVVPKIWNAPVKDWEDLATRPWVLTPSKGTVNRLAHEMLAERGLAPASVTEADQESMIRSLVAAGVGVSFMREDLAREASAADEVVVWPEGRKRTVLCLVYAADREQSPEIRAFVRAVGDVWGKKAPGHQRTRREE